MFLRMVFWISLRIKTRTISIQITSEENFKGDEMISGFLGIDPVLVFFMLLTTISASLLFALSVIEDSSLYPFYQNLVAFVCSFLLAFIVANSFMIGIIKLFYLSLGVL